MTRSPVFGDKPSLETNLYPAITPSPKKPPTKSVYSFRTPNEKKDFEKPPLPSQSQSEMIESRNGTPVAAEPISMNSNPLLAGPPTEDAIIMQETIRILQLKMQKLEEIVELKEEKIQKLANSMNDLASGLNRRK